LWGNLRERDHMKNLNADGRIILKLSLRNLMGALTGLVWFRIRTFAGDLVIAVMNLSFHKMHVIS
jgi:hypothetical protein